MLHSHMQGKVWIGTSGWVYKHWAESFYPDDLKKADEFAFYATQFPDRRNQRHILSAPDWEHGQRLA